MTEVLDFGPDAGILNAIFSVKQVPCIQVEVPCEFGEEHLLTITLEEIGDLVETTKDTGDGLFEFKASEYVVSVPCNSGPEHVFGITYGHLSVLRRVLINSFGA